VADGSQSTYEPYDDDDETDDEDLEARFGLGRAGDVSVRPSIISRARSLRPWV
jgi:hypothetical protein